MPLTADDVGGWAEDAIDEAEKAVRRSLDGTEEELALAGVAALREVTPAIGRRGAAVVADVLTVLVGESDEDRARSKWLATDATFSERRKAMRDATISAVKDADKAKADWDDFVSAILEAGEFAMKKVLPFVLTALA